MESTQVDFELLQDVMTELNDRLPLLEDDMHQLVRFKESAELVASAFRHVHTIKSDFSYCGAAPIADFVHRLENVLQSLRERRYYCSALVAEAVLQSLDRVRDMATTLSETQKLEVNNLDGVLACIDELAKATSQTWADQSARNTLLAAHGSGDFQANGWQDTLTTHSVPGSAAALQMGKHLSDALAARYALWQGRTKSQLEMVLALNQHYSRPMNDAQLTLAVFWHDVGLLAMPDQVFATPPKFREPLWATWVDHPERAALWLLTVDPLSEEAALIIRQHHQLADGRGFPFRSQPGALHPGAQMLACADRFFDGVAGLEGEDYRRGALRAVFDIHGGLDTRFDAQLINAFQAVSHDWTRTTSK